EWRRVDDGTGPGDREEAAVRCQPGDVRRPRGGDGGPRKLGERRDAPRFARVLGGLDVVVLERPRVRDGDRDRNDGPEVARGPRVDVRKVDVCTAGRPDVLVGVYGHAF